MPTGTVDLSTELPTSADRVWHAMQQPETFLYVTRGLIGFPALAGRSEPLRAGEAGRGWVTLFNVVPLYRHTIEVLDVDEETRTIQTHEHGWMLTRWDHTLHVEAIDENRCRYRDTIVIDAGRFTPVAERIATVLFTYRQRRWRRLVAKQLLADGPRYRTTSTTAP